MLAKMQTELLEALTQRPAPRTRFEDMIDELDRGIEADLNYLNFRLFRNFGGASGQGSPTAAAISRPRSRRSRIHPMPGRGSRATSRWRRRPMARARSLGDRIADRRERAALGWHDHVHRRTCRPASPRSRSSIICSSPVTSAAAISGFSDWVPDAAPSATTFYMARTARSSPRCSAASASTLRARVSPVHRGPDRHGVAKADQFGAMLDRDRHAPASDGGPWARSNSRASGSSSRPRTTMVTRRSATRAGTSRSTAAMSRSSPIASARRSIRTGSSSTRGRCSRPAPRRCLCRSSTGSILKVSENADAIEARIGEYANVSNKGPGWNVVGILP